MLDALHSPNSKAAYECCLTGFLDWYRTNAPGEAFSKAVVQRWGIAAIDRPQRVYDQPAVIRGKKLASEAQDNGLLDSTLAQGISRVKGIKRAGVRVGNWLTKEQAEKLLNAPDIITLKGGCGLRRAEISAMRFDHIQQRKNRWVLVDLIGKAAGFAACRCRPGARLL